MAYSEPAKYNNLKIHHVQANLLQIDKKVLLLFLMIITSSLNLLGQRNFFVDNKVLYNCDSTTMIFDEEDSLPLYVKLYWEIDPDSLEVNGKYYYPFIFSKRDCCENIGYIRYFKKKVFILPVDDPKNNSEQILFDFSSKKSNSIDHIYGLSGYTIHKVRRYYNFHFKEFIYVFKMKHENLGHIGFDEIHVGKKCGLIKAHFITHYGPCCDLKCVRKSN